jgi:hypothetical protein
MKRKEKPLEEAIKDKKVRNKLEALKLREIRE